MNWASQGKVSLSDFETDVRFAKLCRILGRNADASPKEDMADLSVVLGVTADDQAAKLVASISPQQMINVLYSNTGLFCIFSLFIFNSLIFFVFRY